MKSIVLEDIYVIYEIASQNAIITWAYKDREWDNKCKIKSIFLSFNLKYDKFFLDLYGWIIFVDS